MDETGDLQLHALIAHLLLDDIEKLEEQRKGKARSDAPLTDAELAFRLQAEALKGIVCVQEDHRIAHGLQEALRLDAPLLNALEIINQGVQDDMRAAAALENGRALPPRTAAQQFMEEKTVPRPPTPNGAPEDEDTAESVSETATVELSIGPQVLARASSLRRPNLGRTVQCVICNDSIHLKPSTFHAHACNHYYCRTCLVDLVQNAIRDESLFPLRCCRQELSLAEVFIRIPRELGVQFRVKAVEFSTPARIRVYCPSPVCSAFLGSTETLNSNGNSILTCTECETPLCPTCKGRAHPNELECPQNEGVAQVRALASSEHWQTCIGCRQVVELIEGCFHMTCTCGTQFCYLCAARWKTCTCRQWDEDRLLNVAQQQVQNQFGPRAEHVNPSAFGRLVQERRDRLRVDHDCEHDSWRYRHGGGHCNRCGYNAPMFLMRCTGCQALACKRCSVNRY